jgi:hypothetical protein
LRALARFFFHGDSGGRNCCEWPLRAGFGDVDAVRAERVDGGFDVEAGGVGGGVQRGVVSNLKGVVERLGFGFGWKGDGGDGDGGGCGSGGGSGEGSDGGGSSNILSYLVISGVEACARSGALAPWLYRGCRVRQLVPFTLSPFTRPLGAGALARGSSGLSA